MLDEETCNVVSRFDGKVSAAHSRIEHFDVEYGINLLLLALRAGHSLTQDRSKRFLYHVFHDIIRRVITASDFALTLFVLQINGPSGFRCVHRFQMELQQSLVDGAQMAFGQIAVIDKLSVDACQLINSLLKM